MDPEAATFFSCPRCEQIGAGISIYQHHGIPWIIWVLAHENFRDPWMPTLQGVNGGKWAAHKLGDLAKLGDGKTYGTMVHPKKQKSK